MKDLESNKGVRPFCEHAWRSQATAAEHNTCRTDDDGDKKEWLLR
jgi:hypothetical protein